MRDLIIIVLVIIAILGGGIFTKNYLDDTGNEMSIKLEQLKQSILITKETGDREQIKKQIEDIEEVWKSISDLWSIVVVHQEVDNIETALIKSKSSIENGELEDALQEIETANFFVNHVREREKVNLQNIF